MSGSQPTRVSSRHRRMDGPRSPPHEMILDAGEEGGHQPSLHEKEGAQRHHDHAQRRNEKLP
eukprot:scaffold1740_cov254-Pinguiococcus_pyrenoidosus.AAC.9